MIKIIFALMRSTKLIAYLLRYCGKFIYFIWKWIKIIASKPATWFLVGLYPIIDLLLQTLTGYSVLLSPVINQALSVMFNMIGSTVSGEYSMNGAINQLPSKALQISAYLGILGALQNFVNGLIHIMVVFITIRITIYVTKLKYRLATKGRIKI